MSLCVSSSCREFYWEDIALIYVVTWAYKFSLCRASNVWLKMSRDAGTCFFSLIIPHTEDAQGRPSSIYTIRVYLVRGTEDVKNFLLETGSYMRPWERIYRHEWFSVAARCRRRAYCAEELCCVSGFREQQVDWMSRNFFIFCNKESAQSPASKLIHLFLGPSKLRLPDVIKWLLCMADLQRSPFPTFLSWSSGLV
jgi:hypothetical protein